VFFYRILGRKISLKKDLLFFVLLIFLYTVYMFISNKVILEPLRTVLSMLLLSVCFKLIAKTRISDSFIITVISGLLVIGTLAVALFMSGTFGYLFFKVPDDTNYFYSAVISLVIQIGLSILAYCTILKINISFMFREDKDYALPLVSGLTMTLFAYCAVRVLNQNNIVLLLTFLWAMFAMGLLFFFLYIRTTIKKHNEKEHLEFQKENLELQKENLELVGANLKSMNEDLKADNHKYADWLPSIDRKIEEKLSFIDDEDVRSALKDRLSLDQIPELIQNRQAEIHDMAEIPATGLLTLDAFFIEQKRKYAYSNISFQVIVYTDLNYLKDKNINIMSISRMVVNNFSNAAKELKKTAVKNGKILVSFDLRDADYMISFFDNAHEFEPEVLARLGVRGNSTNGTGYGWEDTFELLRECGASLEIKEFEPYGEEFTKRISIIFDEKREFIISTYRSEVILRARNEEEERAGKIDKEEDEPKEEQLSQAIVV